MRMEIYNLAAISRQLNKNLEKEKNNQLIVILDPSNKFSESGIAAVEALQKLGYKGVWVALLHDASELESIFLEAGIDTDKLAVIDTLTKMYTRTTPINLGVHYVDSPLSIDEILATAKKILGEISGKRFIVIESVQLLSFYSGAEKTIAFIDKIKNIKGNGTFEVITIPIKDVVNQKMVDDIKGRGDLIIELTS